VKGAKGGGVTLPWSAAEHSSPFPRSQISDLKSQISDLKSQISKAPGLNLTFEVRDGILHHSKGKGMLLSGHSGGVHAATLEGELVSLCDAIAYINHDIDDAVRAGVITTDDLPRDAVEVLGHTTSERINTMVTALIEGSGENSIGMTEQALDATNTLRTYMYARVYPCEMISREIAKAKMLFCEMYFHLIEHPTPESEAGPPEDSIERRTVDFLAGMTDQYTLHLYERLFLPADWRA